MVRVLMNKQEEEIIMFNYLLKGQNALVAGMDFDLAKEF